MAYPDPKNLGGRSIRLAIMQPYFLPYLGYWQLMAAVDRWVIYDDVQYIKGGWINRNRIKLQGKPAYISLKLDRASPNKRICDISLGAGIAWKESMLQTIGQAYARAPYSIETMPLVRAVVLCPDTNLSDYLLNSVMLVREYLGITTTIVTSSRTYANADLIGQSRVIDICRREMANQYVNAEGGRSLYSVAGFNAAGVNLVFHAMRPLEYGQGKPPFVPQLSIVDVLMWLGRENTRKCLLERDVQIVG